MILSGKEGLRGDSLLAMQLPYFSRVFGVLHTLSCQQSPFGRINPQWFRYPFRRGLAADSRVGLRFQRVLQHARTPRSLPALIWKNIKYATWKIETAFASRRPRFWNELGRGFAASEHYEEALACYDQALAIRGDIPQIWSNRGNALRNLAHLDEAEASLREALRLKPDFTNAHRNLGRVLVGLGRWEEAAASVRTALLLEPELADAHHHLADILFGLARSTEAQESYRTALRLQPEHPELRMKLGTALLLGGDFGKGWEEFEWRLRTENGVRYLRRFSVPSWNGEVIGDRVLLIHADGGLGDTIQFCRYVPQIAADARTIVEVQPHLVRLLSPLPGVIEIIARGDRLPSFDLHCPLMSLPRVVGTTLGNIPSVTPYLEADRADIAHWRKRLAGLAGLRVGLCWGGALKTGWGARRSMTLDALVPLGDISGVQFVSLQKGPQAAEVARPPRGLQLHDFTEELDDFADTAALIDNLDLVISIDTAVAHVAGALGKPVWLLNCFGACFRWLQNRDDSPWYPSLRQFRQPIPGDWPSVISRVRGSLQRLVDGDHSQLRPPMGSSDTFTVPDGPPGREVA